MLLLTVHGSTYCQVFYQNSDIIFERYMEEALLQNLPSFNQKGVGMNYSSTILTVLASGSIISWKEWVGCDAHAVCRHADDGCIGRSCAVPG